MNETENGRLVLNKRMTREESLRAVKRFIADMKRDDQNCPDYLKPKCKACDCEAIEHTHYWKCPHLCGDICDTCCKFDSVAPDWSWQECATCGHGKDRHITLELNEDFAIYQEDGRIWKAINIKGMELEDVPEPEDLGEATDENIAKYGKYRSEYTMTKTERHMIICKELNELYLIKNTAYGDAFGKTFRELGVVSAVTRMSDKMNRIIALVRGAKENDESLRDSLKDISNYAIMTLIELDEQVIRND